MIGYYIKFTGIFLILALSIRSGQSTLATFDNRTKEIFKTLIKSYDGEIRPLGQDGAGPTIVSVNLYLRSLEDVQETKFGLEWKPQLTFRMHWSDFRLAFRDKVVNTFLEEKSFITVPSSLGKRLWKPDLFFSNSNEVKIHSELSPNEYWRIYPDGEVLYSVRLTVSMICQMSLQKYPHDKQSCMIRMASYTYTTDDIIFMWKSNSDPIQVTSSINLPKFVFKEFNSGYCDAQTNTGVYSCLIGEFVIERETEIYIDKIYIPLMMCVLVGWLSFFLHPSKAPIPRAIILVACLNYAMNASEKIKDEIPSTSYSTAFDRWSSGCCFFIFIALCEFILANNFATQLNISGPLVKNHDNELLEISLTQENSQAQPQHGDINLLRKLHLQKADANEQRAEWYMQKLDFIFKIIYPICFALFVVVYYVSIYSKDS